MLGLSLRSPANDGDLRGTKRTRPKRVQVKGHADRICWKCSIGVATAVSRKSST